MGFDIHFSHPHLTSPIKGEEVLLKFRQIKHLLGIIEKEVFKVKREQRIMSPSPNASHQGRGIID